MDLSYFYSSSDTEILIGFLPHPDWLHFMKEKELSVTIKPCLYYFRYASPYGNLDSIELDSFKIKLIRPPVVFVHGFNGSHSTFKKMEDLFQKSNYYHDYQLLNKSYKSLRNFQENRWVVPKLILEAKRNLVSNGFMTAKVDVIAHSMGGLLSRIYLQSDNYRNDINKLITLNTPHYGSKLATHIRENRGNLLKWANRLYYEEILDSETLRDLGAGSNEIITLNNSTNLNKNTVPSLSIISSFGDSLSYAMKVLHYMVENDSITINGLLGNNNDGVVSRSSQLGGIKFFSYDNLDHIQTSESNLVINDVLNHIAKETKNHPRFTQTGYKPIPSNSQVRKLNDIAKKTILDDSFDSKIHVITSKNKANKGEKINIKVEKNKEIKSFLLSIIGNDNFFYCDQVDNLDYSIPDNFGGKLDILVIAKDYNGTFYWDHKYITVDIPLTPKELILSEDTFDIYKNERLQLNIECIYDDGNTYDITTMTELTFLSKNEKVKADESNFLTGIHTGEDELLIEFKGLSVTLPVIVLENPESESTGIISDKSSNAPISIYPNPVKDILNVSLDKHNEPVHIKIYSINGSLLLEKRVESIKTVQINISNLQPGLYIVKVQDNYFKFIKE